MEYTAKIIFKSYGHSEILHGVDIAIPAGSITLLSGPSGSGKSTLIRAISLLETPNSGSIIMDGRLLWSQDEGKVVRDSDLYPQVTCVFQQVYLWPHMTNTQNVLFALRAKSKPPEFDLYRKRLGLDGVMSRYPNEVSLGQRQRIGLLRALLLQPRYLFLDEITSALDGKSASRVLCILQDLVNAGVGILAISHDPRVLEWEGANMLSMDEGRIT